MSKHKNLAIGMSIIMLMAVLGFGVVAYGQEASSPVSQLTELAKAAGDNFGKALDYLQGSSNVDEPVLGYVGDDATHITTARVGRLVTYNNVFVTTDLEVDGETFFDATTTQQEVTLGTRFSGALNFAANASSTGGLFSVQNTGADKICSRVEVDITTGSTVGGATGVGSAWNFEVTTSTAATSYALGGRIIASTTLTTTTDALFDSVANKGAALAVAGQSFEWKAGQYLLGSFDDKVRVSDATNLASSTAYLSMAGRYYFTCHTK